MKVIPFNEAPHAPYELGKVPAAGWFAVEPTCEWTPKMQDELRRALNDPSDTVYQARLDAQGLMILEDSFSLEDTDGRGLPTSEQHKFEKAFGWVKALHAEGDMLWAWIEWTPKGHQAVNEGEYVFFSTEYDYPDFEVIDNRVVAPVRLAGLSVTNYPNHKGQLPMTNSRKQANRDNQQDKDMKPTNKTRTAITKPKRDKNSELDQTPDDRFMKAWIKLTTDDLALVFNAKELAVVAPSGPDSANPWTLDTLDDVTAMVRESIASNPANALDDDQATIPRTLRAAAMDIAAVRLLKRFSMAITDERRKAADDAAALLASIARAERKVMGPDGKVHVPASHKPSIIAPSPAYGNDGTGWYPEP